ncbi:unnamed protein product, partial [Symbiodinium sp. KB8]
MLLTLPLLGREGQRSLVLLRPRQRSLVLVRPSQSLVMLPVSEPDRRRRSRTPQT